MPLDATGLTPLDASGLTPVTRDAPQLDAGGLVPLDASGLTPLETPGGSIGDYPVEFGKGVLEGGKNTVATSLKGTAALAKGTERRALADIDAIDGGQRLPVINLRGGPADVMGVQDMPPEERQAQRQALQQAVDQPVTETNLYRGGQAIENFGKETLAPRPGFENGSWTRDIGSGFGSVGAGIVLSILQPEAAQLMWVTSGSGEAVDNAVRAGATPEQIERAAQFGSIPGATDAVDGMLPALGSTGAVGGLIKRVGLGAIKAAFAEGGQEGFQQFLQNLIARGIYKPDQDLLDDVPRSTLIGAIVGGTVGGGTAAAERQSRAAPAQVLPADQSAVPAETILPGPADGGVYTPVGNQPPAVPAAQPQAPAAPIANLTGEGASPIEQALQGSNAGVSTGGVTTPSPQPQNAVPVVAAPTDTVVTAQTEPPTAPPQGEPHGRAVLDKLLNDPRTADEIRAELQAQQSIDPAAVMALPDAALSGRIIKAFEGQFEDGRRVEGLRVQLPRGIDYADAGLLGADGRLTYAGLQALKAEAERRAAIPPTPGSRAAPVELQTAADVHAGAEITNPNPTPAQAESGIYQKRHLKWRGWDISIETEAGADRVAKDGSWRVTMPAPYGHILGTRGADGDPVDVTVGPNPQASQVYVIDQRDPDTLKFDEHKTFQGFDSEQDAIAAYDASFSDNSGPFCIGAVTPMSLPQFDAWLENGNKKKAIAYEAPRAPQTTKRKVLSLFEFLASIGGIKDHGGELRQMGIDQHFIPGFGRLVRPSGKDLDTARESAAEMGYLPDQEGTVNDLLDLLSQEASGQRVYAAPDVAAAQDRERKGAEQASNEQLDAAKGEVADLAKEHDIKLNDKEIEEAAKLALVNGHDLIDAIAEIVERGAYATHDELVSLESPKEQQNEQAADAAAAEGSGRARVAAAGQQPSRPDAGPADERAPHGEQPGEAQRPGSEPPAAVEPDAKHPGQINESVKATKAPSEGPSDSGPVRVRSAEPFKGVPLPAEPAKTPEAGPMSNLPALDLANSLVGLIKSGRRIIQKDLQEAAAKAYGTKLAEGQFNRKDMADALELAVNIVIKDDPAFRIETDKSWQSVMKRLDELLARLPTQRVRSEEQESFQQFSTPPNYSAAAVFAANVKDGDTLLEPSAGTGSIIAAASNEGVKIIANELSERRVALLRRLVGDRGEVHNENAEQIDNILDVKPTVVVMNPPFSQTAGRMGTQKVPMVAAEHIEAALNLLQPGGRLVAIVGRGITMGAPTYRAWWTKIGKGYTVQANVGVDGKVYEKYGTTFGTRLLVIDKTTPESGHKPVLAEAQSVDDLMRALEPIRDGRSEPAKSPAAQPSGAGAAEGSEGGRAAALHAPVEPGGVGTGEPGARGVAADGSAGAAEPGGRDVRVEAGERAGVAAGEPERPGSRGAAVEPAAQPQPSAKPEVSSRVPAQRDLQPAAGGQSGAATSGERAELETAQAKPASQGATEIDESLYQPYEPARVRVKGAKPHPGPLVESASMSSVAPPNVTYAPHIPAKVIEQGKLSLAQLEPVVYAGQAHSKMLPAADGETPKRRGYFIGDGTGVGKGREIAGVILDNWQQGRTKAVWVSEKQTLLQDAKRDWGGLGQNQDVIFNAGKVKTGEPIKAGKGIAFITYDTLKGGMSDQEAIARGGFVRKQKVKVNGQSGVVQRVEQGKRGEPANITVKLDNGTEVTEPAHKLLSLETTAPKSRVDQLVDWLGKDFDGVIAYDEAHNMGNAVTTKGERGAKDAAAKAIAGISLQDRLPNARVVYVSATGATEVSNLAYANRLGLWGRGTPFASQAEFVSDVGEGGIAAMELVARDMKQLGLYTARNLSYDGVEYNRVEHTLDSNQREIYDTLAEAWQGVLRNINAALQETGGNKDGRAKAAAMSAFWGGHQRFFNQIITSLQMPSVIKAVEKDIEAGHQVVLQLTNTNEASQERAAAKATTAEEIEDLDITPRDQIIQLVEKSFPTQEYEQYMDGDKVKSRPVVDGKGEPVQNKKAVAMREALIERLGSIRVPQGPLDMVLDQFGHETVAEVTGRGRRFILKTDDKSGERKRVEDVRGGNANLAETDAFQSGKKKILVFSEAGGTGRSYHADNTSASKGARRVHYLVQGGWRADKAVQGFGRTHRTNQASAPIFRLVTTDLKGQKRFISSIARRLAQLGALTKGQRQAGDQGVFSARDNLESTEARQALQQFYSALLRDELDGITINEFEAQTGLQLRTKDDEGRVTGVKLELPPITTFLNRLLSLKVDLQNRVFDAFSEKLDAVIEGRREAGLLDVGLETVKADKIEKNTEKVVHSIEGTDADTKYVKFTLSNRFKPREFEDVARDKSRTPEFFAQSPRGKVYAVAKATSLTNKDGVIVDYYRLIGPGGPHTIEKKNVETGKDWSKISRKQAETMWADEIAKSPEFVTEPLHLITGAILPIWDRLGGSARVVRLQDDNGEQYIGRVVPSGAISSTLKKLGAEGDAPKVTPASLYEAVMKGGRATLSNGWTLKRSRVAQENRIELLGPTSFSEGNEVKADGVFTERIDYKVRYFVPADEATGAATLARLTKFRTVVELNEGGAKSGEAAAGEDSMFSDAPRGWSDVDGGVQPRRMSKADQAKVREIVNRVARLDPTFADTIEIPKGSPGALAWGKTEAGTAAGVYRAADAIEVALDSGSPRTGYHEAFHRLQRHFLNTREQAVLASETDKLRDMIRGDITRRDVDRMSPEEVEAEAFAIYASNQDAGVKLNNILKRAWNRLRLMLDRLRNALRGMGYQTSEDIFERARSGEIADRLGPIAYRSLNPVNESGKALFSEKADVGADGKPQLVLPGAERSTKQLVQKRTAEPKRSTKAQKTVDGLPLFAREPDPQGDLFSLAEEPTTAVDRQRVMQGFLARGQYLDRAIRVPFDIFGGLTRDGAWKPGEKLYSGAASIITGAKFSPESRFSFLNPVMETVRAGLVDRYGLDPKYVARDRAKALDERAVMLQGAAALKSLAAHNVGPAEARVLQAILTGEDVGANDMAHLAEPIRAAVDQLGQEAVDMGMVSAESFERNRGTYLHRVYKKYEAEQHGLVRMVNNIMGSRRKKIIGDQFRGRGMFQEITLQRLMKDVQAWHDGARGKPANGEKFIRLDEMPDQAQLALDENATAEKPLRTVYLPADQAIPDRYDNFTNQGTWEVRGEKGGKIVIWRDFTKAEREKMGEILDARYTIGKTFMLMSHDLAVGKFYKDIAENEDWARSTPPAGEWLEASEWNAQWRRLKTWKRGDIQWVRVPSVEIPNSGGKMRWGALAGRFVREEIWRDLNEQDIMSKPGVWRTLLTQWKLNKTARSPVVHMNNVMSNFVLMDLLDVRMQDLVGGIRSYVTKDQHYQEAFEHGAFGADMMSQEVRDNVLKPILDEIMRDNTFQQGGGHLGALGQISKLTELVWSKAKAFDKGMRDLYAFEDELFRMATYNRRRELGDTPRQAADHAREQFIDYDIRAPWIAAARNTVLPFISYTYRAAPLIARAVATRPWKLGKYFLLAYGLNAMAYALTGGDEDKERRSLREKEQGRAWIGTYQMTRMPFNDRNGLPVFLDTRRWVPAGDVFDMSDGDIPAWLNIGGPLMIGAELALNRSAFTKEAIVNDKTDDWWDRQGKRADHLYKSVMPSAAWVPGSWYWEKIENAVKGATDRQGRPYSLPLALSSSVGIKLKPQDVDDALAFKAYQFKKVEEELVAEAKRLSNRKDRGIISDSAFTKAMQSIETKRERNGKKADETLNSTAAQK